jgi:hypothetical protein
LNQNIHQKVIISTYLNVVPIPPEGYGGCQTRHARANYGYVQGSDGLVALRHNVKNQKIEVVISLKEGRLLHQNLRAAGCSVHFPLTAPTTGDDDVLTT